MLKPCEAVVRAANLCREAVNVLKINFTASIPNGCVHKIFVTASVPNGCVL